MLSKDYYITEFVKEIYSKHLFNSYGIKCGDGYTTSISDPLEKLLNIRLLTSGYNPAFLAMLQLPDATLNVVSKAPDQVIINKTFITNKISSGSSSFEFTQNVPSTVWIITHNLGFNPAGILVLDAFGNQVEAIPTYTKNNTTLRLEFSSPVSGTAFLS